jgi:hypothetical protein
MKLNVKGLDNLALGTAYIGVSAVVAIVILSYALNSRLIQGLTGVPVVGTGITALQAAFGQVARS